LSDDGSIVAFAGSRPCPEHAAEKVGPIFARLRGTSGWSRATVDLLDAWRAVGPEAGEWPRPSNGDRLGGATDPDWRQEL